MTYRLTGFPRFPAVAATAVAVAALTAVLAAGCSSASGSATTGPPPEKPDITVAVVPTTDSTGFYIALHEGLFAKQGLHVTYVPAISAEDVINSQALGKVDVVGGNYVSDIEAQNNYNHGLRAGSEANPTDSQIAANLDIFAEASVMEPNFVGLFTLPGSSIERVTQLKGTTIGINAPGNVAYLLLASYLEEHGISPKTVSLKYYPFPFMAQMLEAHKVDVAFLAEPFASTAQSLDGLNMLTNLDDGASTAFPIEGYTVTKEFAQKYPHTLAAFERALEQGQQIGDINRAAAEQAMEAYVSTDGVNRETAAVVTFESYPIGKVDTTRIQRVADDMLEFNLLPQPFNVHQMIGSDGG